MFWKKLLIVFAAVFSFYTVMAQKNNSYDTRWVKVEALEKKGLTKSALQEVEAIYKLAIKENNDAQQIKSSMYQVKYRNMLEENSQEKNILFIDTLIGKSKGASKNIMQSMKAEMLWQYLQNNRWKFYNRTKLADEKSTDISTWSLDQLHSVISKSYLASLTNEAVLKETKLEQFDPIIIKGENTRNLRPTLFDFLAHRALEYFSTDERDITKPSYQFSINDAKAFAPVAEFTGTKFSSKDTASLHLKALFLFQDILKFHLNDSKPDALLDADIRRLNFVHQYAVNENKDKLFEAALKNIEDKYGSYEAAAQAMYLRSQIYFNNGRDFDPLTKTTNQYEIKRAKELCEAAIKKFPKSEGGINAQNLLNQILQPSFNLETEQVNVPLQPFRTLVSYKNVKTVYLRLIKTSKEELDKFDRRDYDKVWQSYIALKPLKTWNVSLPDPLDYQQHAAEIKIDAVDKGTYILLASINENFSLDKNIIAKQVTYVSNISYINNNEKDYYVLHRDNGNPLSNTKVQVWQTKYNYQTSRNEDTKAELYTTDKNGFFKMKGTKEYRNFKLQFTNDNDELFLDDNNYNYVYDNYREPKQQVQTFLFTDRSIYRPGQTIYFKGIVIKKENKASNSKVLPGYNGVIQLKDVNQQKVAELKITTNEYGSYHGSFKLPEGVLNGEFSLYDSAANGYSYFSVEEYKRPKFSVEVKKPSGSYRLNDSIKVTGIAKAYAGNMLDGAAVKYRVVRKVRYPIWWSGGFIRKRSGSRIFPPYGRNEEVEITNGTTTTDSKGEFMVTFKALLDESVNKKDQPTFYYEVNADVTDLNGETRSGETSVAVAYQALQLEIKINDQLPADSFYALQVRSANLNDIFEPTEVTVSLESLKQPSKIFRERYWQIPDQFTLSKDEYYNLFPYDVYKDENEMKNWETSKVSVPVSFVTQENKASSLMLPKTVPHDRLMPGNYKIIVTAKDKYGEEVKAEKYIQLTDDKPAIQQAVTINAPTTKAEPGDKISYSIQTGFDKAWLIQHISKMDSNIVVSYPELNAGTLYKNEIAVTENDRGGIGMSYAFVKHNRVYSGNQSFTIPWSNKELNISYATFRDKLLPGSEEKWTVTISGNKGEKLAAEMLAGMYDASLDQFKMDQWSGLNIWPELMNNISWSKGGFVSKESEEHVQQINNYIAEKIKTYDQLINSGDVIVYGYATVKRKSITGSVSRLANAEMAAPAPLEDRLSGKISGIIADNVAIENAGSQTDSISFNMKTSKESNKVKASTDIQIRKNFNETAFFFPDLLTDAEGNVSFTATLPEALTQWKLMTLAHTKDLKSGYAEKTLVTQKPLMVQPNAPRFMREGDQMEFTAKIVNMGDSELTGTATLELLDAATNQPVDGWFKNVFPNQYFTVAAGQSASIKFPVEIPFNYNSALTYRIIAKAKEFSDGEEMALPVLTNKTLVTESLPLNLRNTDKKDFKFEKLLNSGSSESIHHQALAVEYTSNPVWYAVQALPYLMEYPYECAEQTFNRYYANILASYVANSVPKIKAVFEKWKTTDTAALLSNLQKNEELKSALLQETPWVLAAQNESQQKKNIALLFDMVRLSKETATNLNKLKEMQSSNGGFVWFKGGPDDRYITQYIISGIGHLRKLNALTIAESQQQKDIMAIVKKAIPYLDKKIKEDYDWLVKQKVDLNKNNLSSIAVQYLYMRSLFSETAVATTSQKAYAYYLNQSKKYWLSNGKYMQAMIAIVLNRNNETVVAKSIIQSLKENSISNEEMGTYWKEWNNRSWFWYQAPIESQAMMIEAFTEVDKNQQTINDLKTWLLKQKQTQNWGTTKATSEASYALLLGGNSTSLNEERTVSISLGSTVVKSKDAAEAGTGYFKQTIAAKDVKPEMGNISVSVSNASSANAKSPSWGSVYWQYFEDLDKITPSATPLKLVKKLFVERNTDKGPVLEAIADGATLKVGDKVKVRIELRVDRDMEYVHMKDMRAACMEPVNVLSGYKYQGSLGYYESTKDASTNFFFNWLNKGTYVFEYPVFVTHQGNFSKGITTIQCMYAPEFTSHSEGVRVNVEAP